MITKIAGLSSILSCSSLMTLPTGLATPEGVLTAQATPSAIVVAPGAKALVKVRLTVRPEYHVNANPPSQAYSIPTIVTLSKAPGVMVGKPRYPKGTPFKFSFSPQAIGVYQGNVIVNVPLTVSAKATPGVRQITGTVKYQACTATRCTDSAAAKFTLTLQIVKAGY